MPMYEYGCLACNSHFDRLRRMDQNDAGVTCPRCGGEQVRRRLSVFAAHTRGGAGTSVAEAAMPATRGASCGGGCAGCGCASRN